MKFSVILTMCLCVPFLWNSKTVPWWLCQNMRHMGGWVKTNSGLLASKRVPSSTQRLYTTTTITETIWDKPTQGANHLFHWRRHCPQGDGKIMFLPFCWLYWRWMLILWDHHFGGIEAVRKILKFRIHLINNPNLMKYDLTPEWIKINMLEYTVSWFRIESNIHHPEYYFPPNTEPNLKY